MIPVGNPPYKYVDSAGKTTYVKVISFPVPKGSPVSGESMWVKVEEGDENEGVGVLDNDPVCCVVVKCGGRVRYGGGTDRTKARFLEVLPAKEE
jgi:hypothetical protein